MRTLIAIPVYNEHRHVERVLERVLENAPRPSSVLVIDDGSTDSTPSLLAQFQVEVIRHSRNRGYGRSLQDAFRWAACDRFDWVITMDCDEQHEPDAIPDFVQEISRGEADVISGSRYLPSSGEGDRPPADRRAINGQITGELNERLGLNLTDAFCGFKAYRVASLRALKFDVDGYAFPMQFWVQAVSNGLRIKEIPVKLIYNDPKRSFGGPLDDPGVRLAHYRCVLHRELRRCSDRLPLRALSQVDKGGRIRVRLVGGAPSRGTRESAASPGHSVGEGPSLMISPPAREWRAMMASRAAPADARGFREQLGLPGTGPLIMTGHQASFWHPGILAKYIAADAAARTLGGRTAWVVVDQVDPPAQTTVRYPVRTGAGRLQVQEWDVAAGPPRARNGLAPPLFVGAGLERIRQAWEGTASEAGAARHMAATLADLMAPVIPDAPPPTVFATQLNTTQLFGHIVELMRTDAAACVAAHNAAARAFPTAGVRALVENEVQDRFELPLWRLEAGRARQAVYAESLDSTPRSELAPRALLLTGLLRLAGCDLFIHGTGGGGDEAHTGYDRVTGDWLSLWGKTNRDLRALIDGGLAPVSVVTATRHLPLTEGPLPTPEEVAGARWRAHRAHHDPALLDDVRGAAAKRNLVGAIAAARRRSRERADLFRRLHGSLEESRRSHGVELDRLEREAALAAARLADTEIASDRTWAFPLYPEAVLSGLRDEIFAHFGVA